MKNYFLLYIIICFFLLQATFYLLHQVQPVYNLRILTIGNSVMAGLSLLSFYIVKRQLSKRPEAFVRGVYGATFLKLMICMTAILVFVLLNRSNLHKPTLFILFGIYAVYTGVETWLLSQQARKTK